MPLPCSPSYLMSLFDEPGAEAVRAHLRTGVIGAANVAEALAKLADHGLPALEAIRAVTILGLDAAPMTEAQAQRSAALQPVTRAAGLPLVGRACLALAAELGAPAVTADRGWGAIAGLAGISIQVIR